MLQDQGMGECFSLLKSQHVVFNLYNKSIPLHIGLFFAVFTEISRAVKQALLELLAYYNEAEPLEEDWIEERWYRSGMLGKEKLKNTWR